MTRRRIQLAAGSAIYALVVLTLALMYHRAIYGTFWFTVQLIARRLQ